MGVVTIVIPIYKDTLTNNELISLQQCYNVLGKYQITIICPMSLKFGPIHNTNKDKAVFIFLENQHFKSIISYNNMLLSIWFYEMFLSYKFILIYQLDSFVFKDELLDWTEKGYSYIGAPWINDSGEFIGVGNGGLSLRNVKDSLRVLKSRKKILPFSIHLTRAKRDKKVFPSLRAIKNYFNSSSFKSAHNNKLINEDKTFAHASKKLNFFSVPEAKEALSFSFEKQPNKLFKLNNNQLSFGCHAWWKYDLAFYTPIIEKFGYQIKQDK